MTDTLQTQAPQPEAPPEAPKRKLNLNALLVEGRALVALVIIIAIFA